MALLSMCLPILPGKKEKWLEMMNTINEVSAKAEMDKSREDAGVHERTFFARNTRRRLRHSDIRRGKSRRESGEDYGIRP